MRADQAYRSGAQAILVSARDLEEALEAGDEQDIPTLANNLLEAALARESGGVVAGFRDEPGQLPADAPATAEEQLSVALTELEIGEVLLAGSTTVAAARLDDVAPTLGVAVDDLDDTRALLAAAGRPAVAGFLGDEHPDPEKFFSQLPNTVGGIVERTATLGRAALDCLAVIPGGQIQHVVTSVLSAVPEVGALAKAGMRAITRALAALAKLIPEGLGEQVRQWARQWWGERGDSVINDSVRRVLSVARIEAEVAESVRSIRDRAEPPNALLVQGMRDLEQIDSRHARIARVIEKVMKVLSRLIGPLALAIVAAAPWIYAAGAFGLLTALGVGIWIGRDYLDAGVPLERVPGVRSVLSKVAG